jgi:diaminopimelate decarboxylase
LRVRPDVPDAIARAIERCQRPSLVFDLARIDATLARVAEAARRAGVTALFAAKSFPHPAVRALAANRLAGFDVASSGEIGEIAALGSADRMLSVADPTGAAAATAADWPGRLVVSCETAAQVRAAPAHAEIAIRLSASLTGRDPAVGAVLEGSGHRRSRFGLDVAPAHMRDAIAELARAAGSRPVGLHVHHGSVAATSSERFITTARAALAAAAAAEVEPRFLDLGGAWHAVGGRTDGRVDVRADALAHALAQIRADLPPLEIIIEPGRLIAEGAGFACGRVAATRALDDRALCVLDLSRICHLRWSQPELVAPPPPNDAGRSTLFVGPTCYEEDVVGEWTVAPAQLAAGARAVLRHVTGYAVAWNTGFGGVAPADVVMID